MRKGIFLAGGVALIAAGLTQVPTEVFDPPPMQVCPTSGSNPKIVECIIELDENEYFIIVAREVHTEPGKLLDTGIPSFNRIDGPDRTAIVFRDGTWCQTDVNSTCRLEFPVDLPPVVKADRTI